MSRPRGGRALGGALLILLAATAPGGSGALAGGGAAAPEAVPEVRLHGPTGSLPGVAGPPRETLATGGQDPRLAITATGPGVALAGWVVVALPEPGTPLPGRLLAAGRDGTTERETVFLSDPPSGTWRIIALIRADGAVRWAGVLRWRVIIPEERLTWPPSAPGIVLFGGGRTVIARNGPGCYLGTCPGLPAAPAGPLPVLRMRSPEEPLVLTASDGGSLAALRVTAEPLGRPEGRGVIRLAEHPVLAPGTSRVELPGPPGAGSWRLRIAIRWDRGRGETRASLHVRGAPAVPSAGDDARGLEEPGETGMLRQDPAEEILEGKDVCAAVEAVERVAGAAPAVCAEDHLVGIVVALEACLQPPQADPLGLAGVAVGLLDLPDHARVHRGDLLARVRPARGRDPLTRSAPVAPPAAGTGLR